MSEYVGIKRLFDIPVYRCSLEKFGNEDLKMKRAFLEPIDKELEPTLYKNFSDWFEAHYYYPWRYNEIVGYLRLHTENSHISRIKIVGDLFIVRSKRIARGNKAKIFGSGKFYEYWVSSKYTSDKIFSDLLAGIERLRRERPLHRRYLDLESFRNIGPYLDWREYIQNK